MPTDRPTEAPPARVVATAAALAFIGQLRARHGALMFFQSGGYCDGSAPMCYPAGEFAVSDSDVCLGSLDGTPFYIGAQQFAYWAHTQLIIDVVAGNGGMFSLDNGTGQRFLTRSRLFSDAELALLHGAAPAAAYSQHPVLDHLHRHADQGQRVLLGQARFAGSVEHADQLALMVEDRGRRAGQTDVARQVVLVLVHGKRTPLDQAGTHAVRALHAFAPHRALHQSGPGRRMGKGRVAEVIEQDAFAVGQHDGVTRAGELLVQVGHLDLGDGLHIGQAFLALLQFDGRDHFRFGAAAGGELVFVETPDPGPGDPVASGPVVRDPVVDDRMDALDVFHGKLRHAVSWVRS